MMIVRGFGEGGADHLPPGCCIPSQDLTKHQACGGVVREFGRQEGGREAGRQQGGRGEGRQAPLDKCSQIEISPEEAPPSTSRSYITPRNTLLFSHRAISISTGMHASLIQEHQGNTNTAQARNVSCVFYKYSSKIVEDQSR